MLAHEEAWDIEWGTGTGRWDFFVFLSTFLFILICQLKLSHISQYITEGFMNKIVLLFLTPHDSCPAWIYSSLVLILKLKVNFTRMYNPYNIVPLDSIKQKQN